MTTRRLVALLSITTALGASIGCATRGGEDTTTAAEANPDSHGDGGAPDYERIFRTDVVHRIDLVFSSGSDVTMRADLDSALRAGIDPAWHPVAMLFDDESWEAVGMQYKGPTAIEKAIADGSSKFPFRLKFDKFEDDTSETKNQRFYGFKRMNFSSGHKDDSMIREVLASEAFVAAGVATPRAAFSAVYLDYGDGPVYAGLYTMSEDPDDDAFLTSAFQDSAGNLYSPKGEAANFSSFSESAFEKETNQKAADYSDIESFLTALHDSTSSAKDWRTELELTFDVDGFLAWLALNTAMVNGDSYGCIADNYALYGVAESNGRLTFVPEDLNESFRGNVSSCGSLKATATVDVPTDLLYENLALDMPLISLLLADEVYRSKYVAELAKVEIGALEIDAFSERARQLHDLVAPYVVGDEGETKNYTSLSSALAFDESLTGPDGLIPHVEQRLRLVSETLELVQ